MTWAKILFLSALAPMLFSNEVLIVGIAGGSASGKTTLAEKCRHLFETSAQVVHLDDYYFDFRDLPLEEKKAKNYDHPEALDFALLKAHIRDLKSGKAIEKPLYDHASYARLAETKTVMPSPLIILEGCLALSDPELSDLLDIKIYLDLDDDERLIRRFDRDQKERDRTFEEIAACYLKHVKPMYLAYIYPFKESADLVIRSETDEATLFHLLEVRLSDANSCTFCNR